MMIGLYNLSPRMQHLLAIVIVVAISVIILLVLSGAWLGYSAQLNKIEELRFTKANLMRVAAIKVPIMEENIKLNDPKGALFFIGPSLGVVEASIQSKIAGIGQAVGVEISSIGRASDVKGEKIPYLANAIKISGEMAKVHSLIVELESSKPFLFVENIRIRALAPRMGEGGSTEITADLRVIAPYSLSKQLKRVDGVGN